MLVGASPCIDLSGWIPRKAIGPLRWQEAGNVFNISRRLASWSAVGYGVHHIDPGRFPHSLSEVANPGSAGRCTIHKPRCAAETPCLLSSIFGPRRPPVIRWTVTMPFLEKIRGHIGTESRAGLQAKVIARLEMNAAQDAAQTRLLRRLPEGSE